MGKSKKRILNKVNDNNILSLKRVDVLQKIISAVKKSRVDDEIIRYICLFGVQAEELTEFGINYEELTEIKQFLS